MKIKILLVGLALLCASSAFAQNPAVTTYGQPEAQRTRFALSSAFTSVTFDVSRAAIVNHAVQVNTQSGTFAGLTVTVSASTDGLGFAVVGTATTVATVQFQGSYSKVRVAIAGATASSPDITGTYVGTSPLAGVGGIGSGTGSVDQVAYFSAPGTLAGNSGFTINPSTDALTLTGPVSASALTVTSGDLEFPSTTSDSVPQITYIGGTTGFNFQNTPRIKVIIGGQRRLILTDNELIPATDNFYSIGDIAGDRFSSIATPQIHSGASALTFSTSSGDVTALTLGTDQGATFTGYLRIGTNASTDTADPINIANDKRIVSRNFANSTNLTIARIDTGNFVSLGDTNTSGITWTAGALFPGTDAAFDLGTTSFRVNNGYLVHVAAGTTGVVGGLDVGGDIYWSGYTAALATDSAVCSKSTNRVEVNSGAPTCTVSALADKVEDSIKPLNPLEALNMVLAMKPVNYDEKTGYKNMVGFIADWAEYLRPELVTRNTMTGEISGFRYENYTAYLTGAIQAQEKRIAALEARNQ